MAAPAKPAKAPANAPANAPAKGAADAAPKTSGKLLLIILALAVMVGAGGGTAFVMLRSDHAKPKAEQTPRGPAQYIPLEPAFVVNLADAGDAKYLQADVQLLTRDPKTAEAITLHMPLIRNRLVLLLGQQTAAQLNGREGKEQLQAQALNEVKSVLKAQQAPNHVDALLFTSLVIQ